jgi:hypothetical protein
MPKRKNRGGNPGLEALPWKSLKVRSSPASDLALGARHPYFWKVDDHWGSDPSRQVEHGGLGDADDCFLFSIEEVDGSDYVMERDEVGGSQMLPKAATEEQPAKKRKQEKAAKAGKAAPQEPDEVSPAVRLSVRDE